MLNRLNGFLALGGSRAVFDPRFLFASDEKGVILLPENSDVGVGSGVGTVADVSGNGKNATQGTAGNKPILRQNATTGAYYWEFDGTDDFLATAAVDLSAATAVTIFAAVRKTSDAAVRTVVSFGNATSAAGYLQVFAPRTTGAGGNYGARAFTAVPAAVDVNTGVNLSPDSAVLSVTYDETAAASSQVIVRRNGTQAAIGGSSIVVGANQPFYIGNRGSDFPFIGNIYGVIAIGRLCTATEIAATENFLNRRIGAY